MGLDAIEIILEVEDRFGITISDAESEQIRTVGDLAALREIIVDALGVKPAQVVPSANFVKDLGMC
jgi:acyl carrier protein